MFALEQARPRGGVEVQMYSFFELGARWGWLVNATTRPLLPREIDQVHILQESEWATGTVWTGAKHLAYTGIWSPDRPAGSKSIIINITPYYHYY
jgi:hypothetical protein